MKHQVVFDKPGLSQKQVMDEMRAELKKLFKTPRNAPCPCGSKKKFKRCCLPAVSK